MTDEPKRSAVCHICKDIIKSDYSVPFFICAACREKLIDEKNPSAESMKAEPELPIETE